MRALVSANTPSPALFALLAGSSFVGLALAFSVSGYHVLGPLLRGGGTDAPPERALSPAENAPERSVAAASPSAPPAAAKKESSSPAKPAAEAKGGQRSERGSVIRKVPNFPSAVVRKKPKSKAGIQDGLRPGHRVSVVGRKGFWLEIEYENRAGTTVRGWTHELNVTNP